jgi:Zn-dependent protease
VNPGLAPCLGYPRNVFGRSWRIATIRGVPVNVDSSWIWIAVLLTWSLWTQFDQAHPELGTGGSLAYAVAAAVLFFGAVFLHEGAHAVAARLNHIEVHGITLVLFGGFTSARSDAKGPGPAFVIAAVGPATSLAIAGACWVLTRTFDASSPAMASVFGYVGFVNLFMAVFNALPGLPLDGGRMLESVIWRLSRKRELATRVAAWSGMGVGVLVLAGAVYAFTTDNASQAIWLVIIGLFIFQGARGAGQQVDVGRRMAEATVAEAMDPPPPAVPAGMTLSEALDRFLRGHEGEAFPVVDEYGLVIGMVSFNSARAIGMDDPMRPVRDALIPLEHVLVAHPEERLEAVSRRLGTTRAALVLRDGRLVGAITGGGMYRWALSHRA